MYSAKEIKTVALGAALLANLAFAQQPDVTSWRPRVTPVSAVDIDRVSAKSKVPTDCFWVGTVGADAFNILIPDTGVTYWVSQYKLPPGAKLYLQGQYPHARHMSFSTYGAEGMPVDRLNDLMIQTDTGSANPFLANAERQGDQRDYRIDIAEGGMGQVNVSDGRNHTNRLFSQSANGVHQIWYRVYIPDRGTDVKGGVALPKPMLVLADGKAVTGDALCKQIVVKDGAIRDISVPVEKVKEMYAEPGASSPVHPAQNPPRWNAFYNPPLSVTNTLIGTPYEGLREKQDATRRNGFYGTFDNTYMSAYVDERFGQVLVLRAKAPTTPRTYANAPVMQSAQLRYWSVCKNRSLADTAVDACLYDEQVPVDKNGYYTIVMSKTSNRPANATTACGVAWLDWGTVGDGIGNPSGGFLVYRHMMPSAEFYSQSLFGTKKPGEEAVVLGEYYPKGAYVSKADFEQQGCIAAK